MMSDKDLQQHMGLTNGRSSNLPESFRKDIKYDLCMDLVKEINFLSRPKNEGHDDACRGVP